MDNYICYFIFFVLSISYSLQLVVNIFVILHMNHKADLLFFLAKEHWGLVGEKLNFLGSKWFSSNFKQMVVCFFHPNIPTPRNHIPFLVK